MFRIFIIIIIIIICSGRGNGESERRGGGIDFLLKFPGGGGLQEGGGERPRGQEGFCGELGILGGGGVKYFFFGPEMSTKFYAELIQECFLNGAYLQLQIQTSAGNQIN